MISTTGIKPKKKLFHNELIDVYEKTLKLDEINFWKENNRTIFTFEKLARDKGKPIKDLTIDEITNFIAEQDIHKLQDLTDSIERNGVQVPLIVLDDGTLLDGNRRYFASQLLRIQSSKAKKNLPNCLSNIPVWVIKSSEVNNKTRIKILAEENFIRDLKLPWSLDAQARAVDDYYQELKKQNLGSEDEVFTELVSVFGITRQRAKDLLESLKITLDFINEGKDEEDKINRRTIVEEKFVYFWEFLNKAKKGNSKYTDSSELKEVTDVFFKLMALGRDSPIKNVKQIEPLAQAKRDKIAWAMLNEDNGTKLSTVVSIVNDKKENRRADDKIRAFAAWLAGTSNLSDSAKRNLEDLIKISENKIKE